MFIVYLVYLSVLLSNMLSSASKLLQVKGVLSNIFQEVMLNVIICYFYWDGGVTVIVFFFNIKKPYKGQYMHVINLFTLIFGYI